MKLEDNKSKLRFINEELSNTLNITLLNNTLINARITSFLYTILIRLLVFVVYINYLNILKISIKFFIVRII